MKKFFATLLVMMLLLCSVAVAAQAINWNSVSDNIVVSKGFAKRNADFFVKLDKEDPSLEFKVEPNSQFTIDRATGKMTFKGGPASLLSGPAVSIFKNDQLMKKVNVRVVYEWYEYFVIIFAAGYFWIYTINNH